MANTSGRTALTIGTTRTGAPAVKKIPHLAISGLDQIKEKS